MSTQSSNEPSRRCKQRSLDEDSLAARRAAAAAINVGRETLETTSRQTEQLNRADELADRQQYTLDKSARLLRGMTWSGWVANIFSRDVPFDGIIRGDDGSDGVAGIGGTNCSEGVGPGMDCSEVPEKFRPAAQSVINFRCNVQLLGRCSTDEQRVACHAICDELNDVATKALRDLNCLELDGDEKKTFDILLRDMVEAENVRQALADATPNAGRLKDEPALFPASGAPQSRNADPQLQSQDAHLAVLSHNLSELQGIGEALDRSFVEQNVLLHSLHTKSDSLSDQTRTITRKADRLNQRARWRSAKPEFVRYVTLQHVETGKYVTASDGTVRLRQQCHEVASVFGMWKRQGDIVGLQNRLSRHWFGQTLLGHVSCSASHFGKREEWEVGDDGGGMENTTILCAGANWGNGGWLEVAAGKDDETLAVGGHGLEARKKAALWCIAMLDEEEEER